MSTAAADSLVLAIIAAFLCTVIVSLLYGNMLYMRLKEVAPEIAEQVRNPTLFFFEDKKLLRFEQLVFSGELEKHVDAQVKTCSMILRRLRNAQGVCVAAAVLVFFSRS